MKRYWTKTPLAPLYPGGPMIHYENIASKDFRESKGDGWMILPDKFIEGHNKVSGRKIQARAGTSFEKVARCTMFENE